MIMASPLSRLLIFPWHGVTQVSKLLAARLRPACPVLVALGALPL